ncbi:MAG: YfcE family phosphodiesterase [Oscillospiraceae bacterium]|nr:YfcE family phosphodiesterase [Oscillospiraceae bacterium]
MQILVLSDSHGRTDILSRILLLHPDADLIIHCGDGEKELDSFLSAHPDWAFKIYHVCGNCDYTERSPRSLTLTLPFGHKLLAVHGHYLQYGDFHENLARFAKDEGADIALFGHFHTRCDMTLDGVRLFSPGSCAQPRDGLPPSYGLIDIFENGVLTSHAELPRTSSSYAAD